MRLIDVPMGENDVNANTVGDFLGKLLVTLWEEAECFSGKRPFGDGDWQYQVYASLIKAGYEIGELDEYGDVVSLDYSKADEIIADAITAVFAEPVKHGHWTIETDEHLDSVSGEIDEEFYLKCSECGREVWGIDHMTVLHGTDEEIFGEYPYCHCGAKMDGGAENA